MNILKILNIQFKKEDSVQEIRTRLLYMILFLISILGAPALVIAIIEAYMLHQFSTIVVYILFFLPIIIVTIFRKKLKYKLIVYVFISFAFVLAAGNIISYGFSGAGIPIFFSLFALTTLFIDQKAGLFMILISAIYVCVIGYLYITNEISLAVSLNEISTKLISWITALSVLVLLGAITVFSYGIIHTKMLQSIDLANIKANALNEANIKLNKDIQEKIKTEQELRESEARFSSIIEQTGDAMYLSDFDGNIITVNKKACEFLGYERNELLKLKISDIDVNYPSKNDLEKIWNKIIPEESQAIDTQHKCKNGDLKAVEVSLGLYEYSNKTAVLGFARDITERKQTEIELEKHRNHLEDIVKERTESLAQSQEALLNLVDDLNSQSVELEKSNAQFASLNKELESFSYSVSHDLRAPLRAIDGFSLALLEDYNEILDEQGKNYLKRVRNGSQKMALLIDEMLNLSRLGRKALKPTTVNLSEIAQSISNDLREHDPQRPAEFIITKDILCMADPTLIKAVMQNLLDNAWKFTSKVDKAKIEFGVFDIEKKRMYFVKDNGAGFNMDYKNKLFTPFQRLHQESEFPGTGIGLTTVQRIIHRHNGNIWAESEINTGTTFYFTINL